MEEKLLNLMEKMYKEVNDIKNKMASKEDIAKIETKIETNVIDKVRALYDNRELQSEINDKLLSTLNRIEDKIDTLQMETAHVRRVK
ncbi:MAG: hypothetical protein CVU87_13475 [Firmicutes bacterium HGW-Firmicutes-12]|jgi:hypothetical protein|nr:MAG: hypothetical protein CVU87_13475 [Firmicutes bacterium HGW-Firmicutes-12]